MRKHQLTVGASTNSETGDWRESTTLRTTDQQLSHTPVLAGLGAQELPNSETGNSSGKRRSQR